ncbi:MULTISPECIES: pantoate--beta-alanine ligase [Aequorivita]|uniref:Pantothenate synthetase n=2 Tax=Aequorivita TaxID=153265 RepID=A0AB35YRH1_9FLAO|nr:pantoate--beta-alanine ligase [Aequorivita sp. Ant34-E75]WGF93282.1 pantoate--beta-alanine ligase [Aequorivita sp. Ant34-E75]
MVVFTQKETLVKALSSEYKNDKIGFVPTMGALHKGHISLVAKALSENSLVVVSIFVNPTQFNNTADLKKYPRTPEDDIMLLKSLNEDIIVYLPEISDLYEETVTAKKYNFGALENEMEGKHRKGHFDGVGTIVSKLLKIVKPASAYFGEKDFQQLQIVKKLIEIENLPVKIIGCPILREENGLAMSSRNKRLNKIQYDEAAIIYKILKEVREKFESTTIADLNSLVAERFLQNPNLKLEYFEIADEETLKTATHKNEGLKYRAFMAVFAGKVRLIDNISLN